MVDLRIDDSGLCQFHWREFVSQSIVYKQRAIRYACFLFFAQCWTAAVLGISQWLDGVNDDALWSGFFLFYALAWPASIVIAWAWFAWRLRWANRPCDHDDTPDDDNEESDHIILQFPTIKFNNN